MQRHLAGPRHVVVLLLLHHWSGVAGSGGLQRGDLGQTVDIPHVHPTVLQPQVELVSVDGHVCHPEAVGITRHPHSKELLLVGWAALGPAPLEVSVHIPEQVYD